MQGLFARSLASGRSRAAPTPHPDMSAPQGSALDGLRVLVLEDSFLVAEVIAETLEASGCDVVGPVARVRSAVPIARDEPLNGAVLDVNVAGEFCFPVAEALAARGVPFLFVTAYNDVGVLPSRFRQATVLHKPFAPDDLVEAASARFRNRA